MTPYKQLYRHEPKKGIYGDCFRTAIGCLLDLPPDAVPHFFDKGVSSDTAWGNACAWLKEHFGYTLLTFMYPADNTMENDAQALMETMRVSNPGVRYLLAGNSASGVGHFVICFEDKVEHDPSLTDSGIVGPQDGGYYWVTFIGKLV